jgi:hypothetical protein
MRDGPWTTADVTVLLGGDAAGLAVILLAWYEASGQRAPSGQTAWIAGGVAGIILAGLANASWLVRARRSIGARRAHALVSAETRVARQPQPTTTTQVVRVPGARRYHRPSCPLVVGKVATAVTPADEIASARQPCGVCAP